MLVIETRALGRRRPLLDDWSIDLPPGFGDGHDGGRTLRDLIERVVRAEVAAFRRRQKDRALVRVLSEREIAGGAARGRVDSGGRPAQEVDEDAAVGAALAGFEDGLYLVILDGQEQKELDSPVYVRPGSRLVFLRLAFLAGA